MPIPNTNLYEDIAGTGVTLITTAAGATFLIDTSDTPIAKKHCWSKHEHSYARAVTRNKKGRQKTVYLHRLLCPTSDDFPHVDHVNGDPSDCRKTNLRPCTRQQNLRNQKLRSDNSSGFKGVGIHGQTGLYRARARAGEVVFSKGLFKSAEEAARVASMRREALHREFARHD